MTSVFGRVFAVVVMIVAMLSGEEARAEYPERPIRWIVGFPAGGSNDLVARLVGEALAARLGQPVIVENRPGGSNNVATAAVINSPPDGYTWYFVNAANFINASLFSNLPFDFLRDMAPVAAIMRVPNVMDISTSIPATTVAEFIAYAKANPGKLNMASSGVGTSIHLAGEMFKTMAGVDMVHIPYKGTPPAMTDLIAGHVQVIFDNLPSSIPLIRAKKVRGLAVTTLQPSPIMPELPTIAASLPGYESSSLFGVGVAHGTPREIIARLNREVNAVLAEPGTRAKLIEMGGIIAAGSADDFRKMSVEEVEKWRATVKSSGAKVE
jgi:tripartite-type tricarboxylate transporter receptor subunit TctC